MAFDEKSIGFNWHSNNYSPGRLCNTYANTSEEGNLGVWTGGERATGFVIASGVSSSGATWPSSSM